MVQVWMMFAVQVVLLQSSARYQHSLFTNYDYKGRYPLLLLQASMNTELLKI